MMRMWGGGGGTRSKFVTKIRRELIEKESNVPYYC